MSKKLYVYSTLSAPMAYTSYKQGPADLPIPTGEIRIEGGSGVANKNLITPQGVRTEVTGEQLEQLELNPVFALHKENGFIKISDQKVDPEKVAADMKSRDNSAPLVDADFAEGEAPTTSTDDKKPSRKA